MMRKYHVRFGGRGRDVLARGITLPTQCGDGCRLSLRQAGTYTAVIVNQAAYVAGWLKKLRDDRKFLIHAAAQA
jgi:hypothetical protein